MKKNVSILLLSLLLVVLVSSPQPVRAQDPVTEAIKAGVKKVIVALDLQVQRLQNETIWLQNAQKVLENKLSELRLTEIARWTEQQRLLYSDYFEELRKVKAALAHYQRVRDIIQTQAALVAEYRRAFGLFRQDPHFSPPELAYLQQVYNGLLRASEENLDQVLLLVRAYATQMPDAARLELLDQAADRLEQNYSDLRAFNARTVQLSLLRAKERNNVQAIRHLYGLD
ncbi:conjugal transfer protein TraI [Pontibacter qinzhouensis]|uniref:Conjugal transfer protein TraI n=1 Tax=Pontibacter qinzhouensis TaxID=2603253 RepID=A0A5C8J8P1_9BACT|nr:conjugal transfer protein TraI [Pontibacter qinzhouensis]TXK33758.1 conjugal transfer protein TraI [Pontibacter qinzhouensis]